MVSACSIGIENGLNFMVSPGEAGIMVHQKQMSPRKYGTPLTPVVALVAGQPMIRMANSDLLILNRS